MDRVAFQGVAGAFSDEACRVLAPASTPVAFDTFAEVFEALARGSCASAVLPIENSLAGPVPEVAAWLPTSGVKVLAEREQPIRMMLLAVPGAQFGDLVTVESHPMALKQCRAFLAEHGLAPREAFDTAGAARLVAAAADRTRGAVASALAGELYGLTRLREGVEDAAANRTRFLLLAR